MKKGIDVVIGTVFGYQFEHLEVFVNSLQATGFRGDIVFLYNKLPRTTCEKAAACGVKLQDMPYFPAGHGNRLGRSWPVLRPFARRFQRSSITRLMFKAILPLLTTRFFYYHDFLTKNREKYRNVLLTDVRDVVFQRDPLEDFAGGMEAFEETKRMALKDQYQNAGWIVDLFGTEALKRVGDYPVVCAGTIMGDVDSMIRFLAAFEELLCTAKQVNICASDQGVYNYLCRAVIPEQVRVTANGAGRVLTVGTMKVTGEEFTLNADDEILGVNGLVAPVVHQFDRHPELEGRITRKYASIG